VNILNNQLRTADKEWSSNMGVRRGANKSSSWKPVCYEMLHAAPDNCGGLLWTR